MAESDDISGYDYQTPVVCGGCETPKKVQSFCLNCDANLCDSCKGQLIHRKHTVLSRTHPKVVAARMSMKLSCRQHPEENYTTFCNTCQKPCCPNCIPESHDRHSFSQLRQAAKDVRGKLATYNTKLDKDVLENRQKLRYTVEQRLTKTKSDAEMHKNTVQKKCQTFRKSIDEMETSLVTQINNMLKEDTKQLENHLADIKASEERIRRQLASCNDVVTNSSDVQLLISCNDWPDMTPFHIPNIAFPEEVEFRESTWALPKVDVLIGMINRKSDVKSIADLRKDEFVGGGIQKPNAPLSKRNLSGPEMAKMMKIGTRVKRGPDWQSYNRNFVMVFSHTLNYVFRSSLDRVQCICLYCGGLYFRGYQFLWIFLTKKTISWGLKFVAIVFSFIIHTYRKTLVCGY